MGNSISKPIVSLPAEVKCNRLEMAISHTLHIILPETNFRSGIQKFIWKHFKVSFLISNNSV